MGDFTPFTLEGTEGAIIAPFFADVDTRGDGAGRVQYGPGEVGTADAFCVTWDEVGYYNERTDRRNSFQLYLVDRSDVAAGAFDIVFLYDYIEWETGDASEGSDGLGGTSAAAGWSNGSGRPRTSFQMSGSLKPGSFVNGGPNSLASTATNSGANGQHVWDIR